MLVGKFISVLLTVLTTMCQLELPHINVLSKVDLAEQHGRLHFGLEFYTEVLDLHFILQELDQTSFSKKFHKLNKVLYLQVLKLIISKCHNLTSFFLQGSH